LAISAELEAQVRRYYYAEKWKPGTICRHLGVHHNTVQRVLAQDGVPRAARLVRPSQVDAYLPFMLETLLKFPRLRASRLYAMVCERGYSGGEDHFRHQVAQIRPRPAAEAFLRLRTLPGEQAQIDWGHFGTMTIGRATRPLMAFVAVLSYSRQVFLRFSLDARMESFLRGHVAAFTAWDAVPRVLLYDNLKSAVLERHGDAIRFHPTLLAFAGHYRYEPRPVAVARGNEKGRVERAIRYVRDNFFAARSYRDLDDLNAQATAWCNGAAATRPCPEDREQSVHAVFERERTHLMALPDNPFPTDERVEVRIGKTPYARFDRNDYSVPHTHVRRTLTVLASPIQVRVLDGNAVLASHPRSYDRGAQIEDAAHIDALVKQKSAARSHRGVDRLAAAVPASSLLLTQAAARGEPLCGISAALLRLLDEYGRDELTAAVDEALARQVPHPNAVRVALERRREQRGAPPPVPLPLSDAVRRRDPGVRTHALASYDTLSTPESSR
jgi:transposase